MFREKAVLHKRYPTGASLTLNVVTLVVFFKYFFYLITNYMIILTKNIIEILPFSTSLFKIPLALALFIIAILATDLM